MKRAAAEPWFACRDGFFVRYYLAGPLCDAALFTERCFEDVYWWDAALWRKRVDEEEEAEQ